MIRLGGWVEVADGDRSDFVAGPWDVCVWERYAKRNGWPLPIEDAPRFHLTLVLAHSALHVPEGFDVWAQSIVDFELATPDEVEPVVPPTLVAASPG